jgi:hypothetical protein
VLDQIRESHRSRTRRRPPDFAPSIETPVGYVGEAVLATVCWELFELECSMCSVRIAPAQRVGDVFRNIPSEELLGYHLSVIVGLVDGVVSASAVITYGLKCASRITPE